MGLSWLASYTQEVGHWFSPVQTITIDIKIIFRSDIIFYKILFKCFIKNLFKPKLISVLSILIIAAIVVRIN